MIDQLRWQVQILVGRIGVAGVIGLCLIVVTPIAIVIDIASTSHEINALGRPLGTDSNDGVLSASAHLRASPSQDIEHFQTLLPQVADIPAILEQIRQAALRNGVALEEGQFKLNNERGNTVSRYEMLFPAKARYTQVRAFIHEVMQAHPTLALEQATLRRDDPNQELLETQMQFGLFVSLAGHQDVVDATPAQ